MMNGMKENDVWDEPLAVALAVTVAVAIQIVKK